MGNMMIERVQTLADAAASAAKGRSSAEAMQFAQAALSVAKAAEALVASGCKMRDPDFDWGAIADSREMTVEALEKLLKAAKSSPSRSVLLVAAVGNGEMSPNDARAKDGLSPLPKGKGLA